MVKRRIERLSLSLVTFILLLSLSNFLVFWLFDSLPGSLAQQSLGLNLDPAVFKNLQQQYGFGQPFWERFYLWFSHFIQGDFGYSFRYGLPVMDLIAPRAKLSLSLIGFTLLFSVIIGIIYTYIVFTLKNKLIKKSVTVLGQVWLLIPNFQLAIFISILFSVVLNLFPAVHFPAWEMSIFEFLYYLIPPLLTLTLLNSAIYFRFLNQLCREQISKQYVLTAKSKGCGPNRILIHHITPHIFRPLLSLTLLQVIALITGTVIVETVFQLPGIGKLFIDSLWSRDLGTLQALLSLIITFVLFFQIFFVQIYDYREDADVHGY